MATPFRNHKLAELRKRLATGSEAAVSIGSLADTLRANPDHTSADQVLARAVRDAEQADKARIHPSERPRSAAEAELDRRIVIDFARGVRSKGMRAVVVAKNRQVSPSSNP